MNLETVDFEYAAEQIARLNGLGELFESCAKLMTDSLLNGGTIFCIGSSSTNSAAIQFSDMLVKCPDGLRPPLPAVVFRNDASSLQQLQALAKESDFSIFFSGPETDDQLDSWLDACLNKQLTSVLINPDLDQVEFTDKALEIRIEYRSFADYLTSLTAVSNYLTKSIEKQLFGRQT